MRISLAAGKKTDKIQHPIKIKILQKLGIEETYLNKIKAVFNKSSHQHTEWKNTESNSIKIGSTTKRPTLTTLIQCSA